MRYFLDNDQSGDWYIIPIGSERSWHHWVELDEYDERSWEVPSYAERINGHPNSVTFENPLSEICI